MTMFWIIAAALVGLALLFVVLPLLRRRTAADGSDQDELNLSLFRQQIEELDADLEAGKLDRSQYESARHDLEKELLYDVSSAPEEAPGQPRSGRWASVLLVVAVPVAAVVFYRFVGNQAIIPRLAAQAEIPSHPGTATAGDQQLPPMEVLVAKLADKLQNNPDNTTGWIMLARSYLSMGRQQEAFNAFEKARSLAPDNARVTLAYAEALAAAHGNNLQGRPAELVSEVLAKNPQQSNALFMMGLVQYQARAYADAIEYWERLQPLLAADSDDAEKLGGFIQEARNRMHGGLPSIAQAQPAATPQPAASAQTSTAAPARSAIQVEVSLAPELADRVSPDDSLFIFARALKGPPMPLAATRVQAKDLPYAVTLDDAMAMMPQLRLSKFDRVVVGARISKSGNALPQPGDLQGEVQPVAPGQADKVRVVIDSVRE